MSNSNNSVHEHVFQAKDVPIQHVTIFSNQAEVSRIIPVSFQRGVHKVKLMDAKNIIPDTIRVSGTDAGITLVDVEHQNKTISTETIPLSDQEQNDLQKSKKQLEIEQQKAQKIRDTIASIKHSADLVTKFANQVVVGTASSNEEKAWQKQVDQFFDATLEQYYTLLNEYRQELLQREDDLVLIQSEIELLQKKIEDLGGNRNVSYRYQNVSYIEATFDAAEDKTISIRISYMVENAKWIPVYDIRADTETGALEFTYKANISQSTGENWVNAQIELSTAEASNAATIPTLDSTWSIGFKKLTQPASVDLLRLQQGQQAMIQMRMSYAPTPQAFASYSAPAPAPPPKMLQETAHSNQGLVSATFQIPSRHSIPSDNVEHKVTVAILSFKPSFGFAVTPKLDENAYMTADVKNDSDFAILPGVCSIYLDGSYITKSKITKPVSPGESFEISFGKDPGMKVTYRTMNKENLESGLAILGNQMLTNTYTSVTSVRNTKRIPIQVKIHEQIPASLNERVKVNLIEPTLNQMNQYHGEVRKTEPGTEATSASSAHPLKPALFLDKNILVCLASLEPGESKDVKLTYSVQYPRGERIIGL